MIDDVWGSLKIEDWRRVPHISDTTATEDDVKCGRAVFYFGNPDDADARTYNKIELPHCAILTEEVTNKKIPVVLIQAEQAEDRIYVGYRFINGGNGICLLSELELLDAPDDRFSRLLTSEENH